MDAFGTKPKPSIKQVNPHDYLKIMPAACSLFLNLLYHVCFKFQSKCT